MAKFFLFFFTVLLSLSLGLFVGQNYFLSTDSTNTSVSNNDSNVSLNFGFKERFNSVMNSIFASEKIKPLEPEKIIKETESPQNYSQEIKDLHKEYGVSLESAEKEKPKAELPKAEGLKISSNEAEGSAQKGWVIQVGAFQAESDALNIEQKVKELGFPFYYYKADVKGQKWYRVNIGPFETLPEATQFKKTKNVQSKFKDAFVRQL